MQVWTVGEGLGIGSEFSQTSALLIIFEIMRSFFVGSKEQATKLAALHWWRERTEPSARLPSVLEHCVTLTCVASSVLSFWIELKPCWYIALTAYCQARP